MLRIAALAIAVIVFSLAVPAALSSPAGRPGVWTRITDANGDNIDEVGLARTGDGVLHVLFRRAPAPSQQAVWHTPISPKGRVGGRNAVLEGFAGVGDPDAIVQQDGRLRVFFGGLSDTTAESGVISAVAPPSGAGWSREGPRVSSREGSVGDIGASSGPGGTPIFAYAMGPELAFHDGLDPAVADQDVAPSEGCCVSVPDLATDTSGRSMLAWWSNAPGRRGLWVRQVLPSLGPPMRAPGGGGGDTGDPRTPIVARPAGGVYLAYCAVPATCTRVLLWRVGAGRAMRVGSSPDGEDVNVAAGPEGRLWVMWNDGQAARRLHVVRTNKAVTRVGPVIDVAPPKGTSTIWKAKGEGSLGPLDLLASVSTGSSLATWHTQVLPRLSLRTIGGRRTPAKPATFVVTDAGDPISGATVKVAGRSLRTNGAGRATILLREGTHGASATKAGYTGARASVRIR
jgi:hypothetical protein